MTHDDADREVVCTMTAEMAAERPHVLRGALADTYLRTEEYDDGITVVFDGTEEAVEAAATFVSHEHQCCSFATYSIEVAPPYETTRLTITGPEETTTMFQQGMVPLLETESA